MTIISFLAALHIIHCTLTFALAGRKLLESFCPDRAARLRRTRWYELTWEVFELIRDALAVVLIGAIG